MTILCTYILYTCIVTTLPPTGAIAGIVLAIIAIVVIAIVVAIVLAIVGYKLRTGEWFKLKHKDEETLAVDFEKAWLMEDDEPGRRKRSNVKVYSVNLKSLTCL